MQREVGKDTIGAGPLSAMFQVTTANAGYFMCHIEREKLVSFNEKLPLPDADMDMGGLSGGPVFLVGDAACPLVGVVSEYHPGFALLRIATLEDTLSSGG